MKKDICSTLEIHKVYYMLKVLQCAQYQLVNKSLLPYLKNDSIYFIMSFHFNSNYTHPLTFLKHEYILLNWINLLSKKRYATRKDIQNNTPYALK